MKTVLVTCRSRSSHPSAFKFNARRFNSHPKKQTEGGISNQQKAKLPYSLPHNKIKPKPERSLFVASNR